MKIYELTISDNYVHTWGVEEAVREIMQNAIDSEIDGNPVSVSYEAGKLIIKNEGCVLNIASLVLGNSGKNDTSKYIGTYGEGFKLALIVLVRNGINVGIYTNGQKWVPKFKKSRKFGIDTLHINVDENSEHEVDCIAFELNGIDIDTFKGIRDKNIAMLKAMNFDIGEIIETDYGNILIDDKYKGMMFVNGLYVQTDSSFQYGYDFKPEYLHLDRDRKAINYYKMRELTAKAITSQDNIKLVNTAISRRYTDIKDIVEYMDAVSEEFKANFAHEFLKNNNIDEDTFVGLSKEVKAAKAEKSFIVDSIAIAELVNHGLGKYEDYKKVKDIVGKLSKEEEAYQYYNGSDYQTLIEFLAERKHLFTDDDLEELIDILKSSDLSTSYFDRIEDRIFSSFIDEEIEDDEDEE